MQIATPSMLVAHGWPGSFGSYATVATIPETITDLTVRRIFASSVGVSFSEISGATSYQEQHRIGAGAWSDPSTLPDPIIGRLAAGLLLMITRSLSYRMIDGLISNTTYDIQVRAVDASGAGAWSNIVTVTTAPSPGRLSGMLFLMMRN